jgi:hypothetical protein
MTTTRTREALARAAREADSAVEHSGLVDWITTHRMDVADLHYVAEQRAMRAAMLLVDGATQEELKRNSVAGFRRVTLTPTAAMLLPILTACVLDGFAMGLTVQEEPTP